MTKRILTLVTAVAAVVAALALAVGPAGAKTSKSKGGKGKADSGVAYFSITHTNAAKTLEYAAGDGKDKRFGTTAATYELKLTPGTQPATVNIVAKKVTLYNGTGSLSGTATATVTLAGSVETITNGKLSLTKGTGSLKGKTFTGTFSGTGNTTANQYAFSYKGTIK